MIITCNCESHIYAEESIQDFLFTSKERCGTLSPEFVEKFLKLKYFTIEISYNENTTLDTFANELLAKTYGLNFLELNKRCIYFLYNNRRYSIDNGNSIFLNVLKKYLDPERTNIINIEILVRADAGTICKKDGLRFFVHSHELTSHNKPHVHIETTDHQHEVSLAIDDGSILDGNLPQRLLRKAQAIIHDKKEYFSICWNTKTDGLKIDINKDFKLIDY